MVPAQGGLSPTTEKNVRTEEGQSDMLSKGLVPDHTGILSWLPNPTVLLPP